MPPRESNAYMYAAWSQNSPGYRFGSLAGTHERRRERVTAPGAVRIILPRHRKVKLQTLAAHHFIRQTGPIPTPDVPVRSRDGASWRPSRKRFTPSGQPGRVNASTSVSGVHASPTLTHTFA